MRNLASALLVLLVSASCAFADETADRAAIESLIVVLNDRAKPASDQFTREAIAAGEAGRLSEVERTFARSGPLSETTEPRLMVRSVRFLTPDMALVDASLAQYGSVIIVRSVPIVLVMKKIGNWRVEAIRSLALPPLTAPYLP